MIRIAISEPSQVAEARRLCVAMSHGIGFDEMATARAALIVTELATNLIKHAHGGEILAMTDQRAGEAALHILALDKGPGMSDVQQCTQDGYSTAGSAGTGLGAILRQAQDFDITSQPGVGTAIFVRLEPERSGLPSSDMRASWAAVCLPKAGELANGDAWSAGESSGSRAFLIADGLGHGVEAAAASLAAVRTFKQAGAHPPAQILAAIHEALRPTRGAAVAIARLDTERDTLVFAGIGNINATIITADTTRRTVSLNGTAGHLVRRIQEFEYPFTKNSVLVMHSDGLGSSWSLDRYPGLVRRHPALVAGVLYRDYTRVRDDVTVLVARPD